MLLLWSFVFIPLSAADFTPCRDGSFYISQTDKCYTFPKTPQSFIHAQLDCVSKGGELVKIASGFENADIAGIASGQFGGASDFWIGATSPFSTWLWTDWTAPSYTKWAPGQPDNAAGLCASMQVYGERWQTAACQAAKPYVCMSDAAVPPTTPPPTSTPSKLSCDSEWRLFGNHCYYANTSWFGNYTTAEETCLSLGAHLPSIHSQQEFDLINSIGYSYTWTGIHYNIDHWMNTDGSAIDWAFPACQPKPTNNMECVMTSSDSRIVAMTFCVDMRHFTCKKPANQ